MNITAAIRTCLECGGKVFDNREDKRRGRRGPKSPDFKCKDDPDHVFWLNKKGVEPEPEHLADDEPRENPPSSRAIAAAGPPPTPYSWADLAGTYQRVLKLIHKLEPTWPAETTATAAQGLLEHAIRLGLKSTFKEPAPAEPPPRPPRPDAPLNPPQADLGATARQGHPAPAPPVSDPEYGEPPRSPNRYRGRASSSVPAGRVERPLGLPEDLGPEDPGADDDLPF